MLSRDCVVVPLLVGANAVPNNTAELSACSHTTPNHTTPHPYKQFIRFRRMLAVRSCRGCQLARSAQRCMDISLLHLRLPEDTSISMRSPSLQHASTPRDLRQQLVVDWLLIVAALSPSSLLGQISEHSFAFLVQAVPAAYCERRVIHGPNFDLICELLHASCFAVVHCLHTIHSSPVTTEAYDCV